MFTFATPILLLLPLATLAIGLPFILRARTSPLPIASTLLWQGLTTDAPARAYCRFDLLWLLLLTAATLAAFAPSQPQWQPTTPAPTAQIHAAVRSLNAHTQLYLRIDNPTPPTARIRAHLTAGQTIQHDLLTPSADHIIPLPPADDYQLAVTINNTTAATYTFHRPGSRPFSLLTNSADPALERLLRLTPGCHPDDPSLPTTVLLTDNPQPPPPATLTIAGPNVPLPGITPGPTLTLPADTAPSPSNLPPYINLQNIRIHTIHTALLSKEWIPLLTAAGHPFLAERQLPSGQTLIWIAFHPSTDSTWPADPSFVLTFSHLLSGALPSTTTTLTDWTATVSIPSLTTPPSTSLAPAILLLATTFLLIAMCLFAHRAGPVTAL